MNAFNGARARIFIDGAGATYGDETEMRAWAVKQGCTRWGTIKDAVTDTLVFIAASATDVYVCFRGTQDLRNWMTDLDCRRVAITLQIGPDVENVVIEVHEGFNRAWGAVKEDVLALVKRFAAPSCAIWFIGHSLGGALAMLATAQWTLDVSAEQAECYTFGQPRVGNAAWRAWYDSVLKDRTHRLIHAEDIVPRVPWLLGAYRHAGTEVFFDAAGIFHLDLPWWGKTASDVFGTWAEWSASGRIAQLADHSWTTYQALLNPSRSTW